MSLSCLESIVDRHFSIETPMTGTGLSEHVKQNYDRYYDSSDSEWRRLGALDKAANVVALCDRLAIRDLLEIGAGDGAVLQRLADLGLGERRYALEISPSGVAAIQRRNIDGLKECGLFDGYHVPYGDGALDLAILSHVIEHAEHPRQLLYEAARVARHVFVEVPLEDTKRLSSDLVFDQTGHINFFSLKTIRLLLRSSRLRIVRELVTNPSIETYLHASGRRGSMQYWIKQALLRGSPTLATKLFCYHASFLCVRDA
jgi:SAM-dependent methyltransferase